MGIPAELDCLTFARRAAAAHFNGTLDQLNQEWMSDAAKAPELS